MCKYVIQETTLFLNVQNNGRNKLASGAQSGGSLRIWVHSTKARGLPQLALISPALGRDYSST